MVENALQQRRIASLDQFRGYTVAGMFLVQSGERAEPLVEEAIDRRQHMPTVLVIAGDIGAVRLEPELRRLTKDPDPDVAKAAQDGLRILAAKHPPPSGSPRRAASS